MQRSIFFTKSFSYLLSGFCLGLMCAVWLTSLWQTPASTSVASTTVSTTTTTIATTTQTQASSPSKFVIDHGNIAQFYAEFYRYYELNKEWIKKSFLGVHFLQNPNDAITIAEILHDQDVDLVIETGTYRGGAAIFFASIMYQYRYKATDKAVRPFRIITMDINPEAKEYIDRYPLLAAYITFIPQSSVSPEAKSIVNSTFAELKPANVFISLDGDHYAQAVYDELVYYQKYAVNVSNYILVQDTRLSSRWHTMYCASPMFDGPCNGPQEGVNWFMKNEGQGRFVIDPAKEYLFSTHHNGWLKRIA